MKTDADRNELPPTEKAKSLEEQASQARRDGQDQAAMSLYIQSLNLYRGLGDRANILRMLIRLSYMSGWADFGDGLDMFERRRKLGEEAMPLAREIGDKALLAEALVAFAAGQSADIARPMLEESATLAEECGDRSALAWAKTRMAGICSLEGDNQNAANALNEQALALHEEVDDKAGMAGVLFSMSIRADRPQKRAYLGRALDLQRELGAKQSIVRVLMRLQVYCDDDEIDLQESYNLEALDLCCQIDSPIWLAGCLDRLAEIARKRGDIARAEALETESKSVYQPPPPDPELEEALKAAFSSGNIKKMEGAVKKMGKR